MNFAFSVAVSFLGGLLGPRPAGPSPVRQTQDLNNWSGSVIGAGPELEKKNKEWGIIYNRALEEIKNEEWVKAEVDLEKIPLRMVGLQLSRIYERQGRLDDARVALATEITPIKNGYSDLWYEPDVIVRYGELCRKCGLPRDAEEAYRRAVNHLHFYGQRLDVDEQGLEGDALRFRAIVSAALSDFHERADHILFVQKARELNPTSPWTYLVLAWDTYFGDGWDTAFALIQAEYHATGQLRKVIHDIRSRYQSSYWDGKLMTLPGETSPNPPADYDLAKSIRILRKMNRDYDKEQERIKKEREAGRKAGG